MRQWNYRPAMILGAMRLPLLSIPLAAYLVVMASFSI